MRDCQHLHHLQTVVSPGAYCGVIQTIVIELHNASLREEDDLSGARLCCHRAELDRQYAAPSSQSQCSQRRVWQQAWSCQYDERVGIAAVIGDGDAGGLSCAGAVGHLAGLRTAAHSQLAFFLARRALLPHAVPLPTVVAVLTRRPRHHLCSSSTRCAMRRPGISQTSTHHFFRNTAARHRRRRVDWVLPRPSSRLPLVFKMPLCLQEEDIERLIKSTAPLPREVSVPTDRTSQTPPAFRSLSPLPWLCVDT